MSQFKPFFQSPVEPKLPPGPDRNSQRESVRKRSSIRVTLRILAALSVPAFFLLLTGNLQESALRRTQGELKDARTRNSQLLLAMEDHQHRVSQLSQLRARLAQLGAFRGTLLETRRGLSALQDSAQDRCVWLTRLKADQESIHLEGLASRFGEVSQFVDRLKTQAPFCEVDLLSWVRTQEHVAFTVRATLNSPPGDSQ